MKTIELYSQAISQRHRRVDCQLQSLSPGHPTSSRKRQSVQASDADPTSLDSWLAIAPDGTVTVFSGKVDLGTGAETALAQIVAEELDVPFDKSK